MLEREVGAERYFRSLDLTFERKRDRIHPTLASSQLWMDAVASWLVSKSAVPVRMNVPQKTGAPRPSAGVVTVLQARAPFVAMLGAGALLAAARPEQLELLAHRFTHTPVLLRAALVLATIQLTLELRSAEVQPFLYFQF